MTRTLILGHHVKAGETFRTMLYEDGQPKGMTEVINGTPCEFGAGSKLFATKADGDKWLLCLTGVQLLHAAQAADDAQYGGFDVAYRLPPTEESEAAE